MISMQTKKIRTCKVGVIHGPFSQSSFFFSFPPLPRKQTPSENENVLYGEEINELLNEIREPENGGHILSVDFQKWLHL